MSVKGYLVCVLVGAFALNACGAESIRSTKDNNEGRGGDSGVLGGHSTGGSVGFGGTHAGGTSVGGGTRGGADAGGAGGTTVGGVGGTNAGEAGAAGEDPGGMNTGGTSTGGTNTGGGAAGRAGAAGRGGAAGIGGAGAGAGGKAGGAGSGLGGAGNGGAAGVGNAGGSAGSGGGRGGAGGHGEPGTLIRVLGGAAWSVGQQTTGIAVDEAGRVYVQDYNGVEVVEDGIERSFLRTDQAGDAIGRNVFQFRDLDIGPDGYLYILADPGVLRTITPGTAELWVDFQSRTPNIGFGYHLGVLTPQRFAVVGSSGLFQVTSSATTAVYDRSDLGYVDGCATQDLATSYSGVFLYQPGCNGSPLLRGDVDGSGVAVLYDTDNSPVRASNFGCSARDPFGGFYVLIRDEVQFFAPRLYHLTENSDANTGVREIVTTPTFVQAQASSGSLSFAYCSLAGAPDGSVYIQTFSELWQAWPAEASP